MNREPLRARYGAKDRGHALLHWPAGAGEAPPELLGLTDRPPGHLAPGEVWGPAVGCGPVRVWWAVWRTVPDPNAGRSGMVQSEVALWPLEEVGALDDLAPALASLGADVVPLPQGVLEGAFQALLDMAGVDARPVFSNLEQWPSLLASVWKHLRPEARHSFTARTALTPDAEGHGRPLLYARPPSRAADWANSKHKLIVPVPLQECQAAVRFLLGDGEPALAELVKACAPLEGFRALAHAQRAAQALGRMRAGDPWEGALPLIRALAVLAPRPDRAQELKSEAWGAIASALGEANAGRVLALANVSAEPFLGDELPRAPLAAWVRTRLADLACGDGTTIAQRAIDPAVQGWWRDAVKECIRQGLADPNRVWSTAAIVWMGRSDLVQLLDECLPSGERTEQRLTASLPDAQSAEEDLLLKHAERRGWSRFHAAVLRREFSPREALRRQRCFPGENQGLRDLVESLPGVDVLQEALEAPDARFTAVLAARTRRESHLLATLDPKEGGWRSVWLAHLEAGGAPWPPGADRTQLAACLLDTVLQRAADADTLVRCLASELAEPACRHRGRAQLWNALSSETLRALLPGVAQCFERGLTPHAAPPESTLREEIKRRATQGTPSVDVALALVRWDEADEQQLVAWLSRIHAYQWECAASSLGQEVNRRQWRLAASALYQRRVTLAVAECWDLLPALERWSAQLSHPHHRMVSHEDHLKALAELGTKLYEQNEGIAYLWDRAGGKQGQLDFRGPAAVQWHRLVRSADDGALPDGILGLVREMLQDYPHNKQLNRLGTELRPRR